jgi:hypothetical protein
MSQCDCDICQRTNSKFVGKFGGTKRNWKIKSSYSGLEDDKLCAKEIAKVLILL